MGESKTFVLVIDDAAAEVVAYSQIPGSSFLTQDAYYNSISRMRSEFLQQYPRLRIYEVTTDSLESVLHAFPEIRGVSPKVVERPVVVAGAA